MGKFVKGALLAGSIGLVCLVAVLIFHGKQSTKIDLENARMDVEMREFDREFDESWNRQKSRMAEAPEEKEFWQSKIAADNAENDAEIDAAREREKQAEALYAEDDELSREFEAEFEKAIRDENNLPAKQ